MLDATLSLNDLQNDPNFMELVREHISNLQKGDSNHELEMQKESRIAIYLRASHKNQEESIASQLSALKDTVKIQTGQDISDCLHYIDDGMSARKNPHFYDRKPKKNTTKETGGGSRLWQDIQAGKIDYVFAYSAKRLFRRTHAGSAWILEMAQKFPHVEIRTLDCPFDHRTAKGGAMWNLFFTLAELENEERAEATQAGMQRTQEQLQKTSSDMWGWFWSESHSQMRPHWVEQNIRDWVLEESKNGQSNTQIANHLNKLGIKTVTGREFKLQTIRRFIKTPPKYNEELHRFTPPKRVESYPWRSYRNSERNQ